jgi:hypothetical protein
MTEHLNRRTFIGLFTGIAAFLGFTQKAKAEKPYTEEELEAPSRPMLSNANFHESGKAYGMVDRLTFPDKALVPKKPAVFDDHERKRQEEINLKTSAFLICPQCGSDMHWARCECGFVWTNRVDEVAGGGQRQYDVKPVEYPSGIADSKTLVAPFRPTEAQDVINAAKAIKPTTAAIPETEESKVGIAPQVLIRETNDRIAAEIASQTGEIEDQRPA